MVTGLYYDGAAFEADAVEKDEDGRAWPVVFCEEVKRGGVTSGWRFKCRYCGIWHNHGAGPGHRVSHCPPAVMRRGREVPTNSRYIHGYVLRLAPSSGR